MLKVLGWISEAQSNFWVAGQTNRKPSVGTLQRDWAFKATAHQPSQLWDVSKRVLKTGLFFLAAAWRKYIKSAFTTHKNWYLTKGNIFITSEDVPSLNSWRELIAVWSAEEFHFLRFRIILANATKSLRVAKYTYFHFLCVESILQGKSICYIALPITHRYFALSSAHLLEYVIPPPAPP